jgi:3-(methylthio)propionyl---CoA ligase
LSGADLILPGTKFDGASVHELITNERVTMAVSVPAIWNMLHAYMLQNPTFTLSPLNRVYIGGSAMPPSQHDYFRNAHKINMMQGFGMTEMSPVGTQSNTKGTAMQSDAEMRSMTTSQGRPKFGFNMKIVDEAGNSLPQDGNVAGRLKVKGPTVARSYFKGEEVEKFDADGWFDTGDVGSIDPQGYLRIIDRAKDLIKSGGEWISSIELENIAMGCEGVEQAAAIGVPHPKWDERPLLVVVCKPDSDVSSITVLRFLEGKIAKWWTPDAVVFVESLPLTGTGKVSKLQLREMFKNYQFES